ncbi:unnamed protein product, partial [Ectocarpus sp. 12 AP-2014]
MPGTATAGRLDSGDGGPMVGKSEVTPGKGRHHRHDGDKGGERSRRHYHHHHRHQRERLPPLPPHMRSLPKKDQRYMQANLALRKGLGAVVGLNFDTLT